MTDLTSSEDFSLIPGMPEFDWYVKWIAFVAGAGPTPTGRYLSEKQLLGRVRRAGLSAGVGELWWSAVQAMRAPRLELPFFDADAVQFRVALPSYNPLAFDVMNAEADPRWRGTHWRDPLPVPAGIRESAVREEAIASCILDGVPVDRPACLEMFESRRAPVTESEQAVAQLHRILRDHLSRLSPGRLSPLRVRELHAAITDGLAAHPGALRNEPEIQEHQGAGPAGIQAPAPDQLEAQLGEMCRFADGESNSDRLPRLVRAILVHFWVVYAKPFAEANGRVARVLYYAMIADERRPSALEVLPISSGWLRARRAYSQAFHDARADGNDAGYFVHGQLRMLRRGIYRVLDHVDGIRQIEEAIRGRLPDARCNMRQFELLFRARARPNFLLTINAYRGRHGITYETARTDLLRLVEAGLLEQSKQGRAFAFRASPALQALIVKA